MSEELAEKKKAEIEALERQEAMDEKLLKGDICPICGTSPTKYPYIAFLPNPYGWLECAACGIIYCPKSLRDQKIAFAKSKIKRPSSMIIEGV